MQAETNKEQHHRTQMSASLQMHQISANAADGRKPSEKDPTHGYADKTWLDAWPNHVRTEWRQASKADDGVHVGRL